MPFAREVTDLSRSPASERLVLGPLLWVLVPVTVTNRRQLPAPPAVGEVLDFVGWTCRNTRAQPRSCTHNRYALVRSGIESTRIPGSLRRQARPTQAAPLVASCDRNDIGGMSQHDRARGLPGMLSGSCRVGQDSPNAAFAGPLAGRHRGAIETYECPSGCPSCAIPKCGQWQRPVRQAGAGGCSGWCSPS